MKKFILLFVLFIMPFQLQAQEKISFGNKLCFYEEDDTQQPVRFVYQSLSKDYYIFTFVEEDKKSRILKKTEREHIKADGVTYSKGQLITKTPTAHYYEICINRS